MKTTIITALLLFAATRLAAQFVINEIHAVPSAGEPEWIELHNTLGQVRVLRNALISDRTSTRALPDIRIPARGFALLTRDTLALLESRALAPGAVLVELQLPSLNNTTDVIVLRSADSTAIDSVYYNTKWGARGISLERIDPFLPAVSPANLAMAQSPDSATAGATNSVVLLDRDARLLSVATTDNKIAVRVGNNGRNPIDNCELVLWLDADADGTIQSTELFARLPTVHIDSGTVYTWSIPQPVAQRGYVYIAAAANFPPDERRYNDTLHRRLFFSYPAGTVLINEIMCQPPGGGSDYVELWNSGPDTLLLDGWRIHDRPTSTGADTLFIRGDVRLPPGGYLAIACDSGIFHQFPELIGSPAVYCGASPLNFNTTDDIVALRDPNGVLIDSVAYSSSWHIAAQTAGFSLEKLNPALPSPQRDSWSTAGSNGGTPGRVNSIAMPLPEAGLFAAAPNPFSPARDGVCLLSWSLPFRQAYISSTVYNTDGIPQRALLTSAYTSANGFFAWNGENDSGTLLPPGPYVVLLEAVDAATGRVAVEKLLVVIRP